MIFMKDLLMLTLIYLFIMIYLNQLLLLPMTKQLFYLLALSQVTSNVEIFQFGELNFIAFLADLWETEYPEG